MDKHNNICPIHVAPVPLLEPDQQARDQIYKNLASGIQHPWLGDAMQKHVEELYECTHGLLDKKFKSQAQADFPASYSEMYLAAVARHRLSLEPEHPDDFGPDLFLPSLKCWAEIVTATNGEIGRVASIPEPQNDESSDYPEDRLILRLTNSFANKSKELLKRINDDKPIIKRNHPVVICINGGWLHEPIMHWENEYHPIIKALLPVGNRIYWLPLDQTATGTTSVSYQDHIIKPKLNDGTEPIKTNFFASDDHSHISAVVFFTANINQPISRPKWGCDFVTVHNPFARNQIPVGSFPCGREYHATFDENKFIIHPAIHYESESP